MRGWLGQNGLSLLLALLGPFAMAAVLLPVRGQVANTQVALVLVVVIVAVAATGHRVAGILAAVSAGVWFDFFYTRPFQDFAITGRADLETFVLLVIVGVAVTELAVWGRRQQAIASRQAGYLDGIHTASDVGATGGEPTTPPDPIARRTSRSFPGTSRAAPRRPGPPATTRPRPPRATSAPRAWSTPPTSPAC